jgi:hypothetical protein
MAYHRKRIPETFMLALRETDRTALLVVGLATGGFALTLYIFYPGIMTFDSLYVYKDTVNRAFGDWQSPVMLALWMVIDPIAPGPGSIFLLTAALYWLAFTIVAIGVARHSPRLALLVPVLGLSPPAFVLVGVIWRDILFGVSWLLAAGLVFLAFDRDRKIRIPLQVCAFALVAFGVLLRPNALVAAPLLAAYVVWPSHFRWRRAVLFYMPAALGLFALVQVTYYGVFGAERQHPLQSIMVFDLGGISRFADENMFPGSWTDEESALITRGCYKPVGWDIYWTQNPCMFVMERLENEKLFGTSALARAWRHAIVRHPMAYLQHRAIFQWTFLADMSLAMWSRDLDDPDKIAFADKPRLMALKSVNDALNLTPLFRAGAWLLFNIALCIFAWRRRDTPTGAFVIGISGSAAVYVMTFFAVGVSTDLRYAYWAVLAALTGTIAVMQRRRKSKPFMEPKLSMAS